MRFFPKSPPGPITFRYRGLDGTESSVKLREVDSAIFKTVCDDIPYLAIKFENGAWVLEQLTPTLTLDRASIAWAKKQ